MADGDVTDVADSEKAATSSAVLSESSYRHPFNDNDAIRSMSGSVGESAVKSLLDTKGHALETSANDEGQRITFPFEKLPIEIRLMIYRLSLRHHGHTLLVALRPCHALYTEVLEVFSSISFFDLRQDSFPDFKALKEEELAYLRRLRITATCTHENHWWEYLAHMIRAESHITLAKNVEELHIRIDFSAYWFRDLIKKAGQFPRLRTLHLVIRLDGFDIGPNRKEMIDFVEKETGIKVVLQYYKPHTLMCWVGRT